MTKKTVQAAIAAVLLGGTLISAPAASAMSPAAKILATGGINVLFKDPASCSFITPIVNSSGASYYEDYLATADLQVDALVTLTSNAIKKEWVTDPEIKATIIQKIADNANQICKTSAGEPLLPNKPQPKPAAEPEKKAEDSFSAKLKGLFGSS